jgi:hypothetical protein
VIDYCGIDLIMVGGGESRLKLEVASKRFKI